jgi:hypothetical protein
MDPNVALREIRVAIEKIRQMPLDALRDGVVDDLIEHVEALDDWLSNGGFLPDGWADHRRV